jgi:hypothetical protein
VNSPKLEVNVYFGASDAVNALLVVPDMVALIFPKTVKSPEISPEPDTEREPVINGSNIFIYVVLYINKYFVLRLY